MFVPTHIFNNKEGYVIVDGNKTHLPSAGVKVRALGICDGMVRHYQYYHNELTNYYRVDVFNANTDPITLTCPYCGTSIQQDERVECECGWVGQVLDREIYLNLVDAFEIHKAFDINEINGFIWFTTS